MADEHDEAAHANPAVPWHASSSNTLLSRYLTSSMLDSKAGLAGSLTHLQETENRSLEGFLFRSALLVRRRASRARYRHLLSNWLRNLGWEGLEPAAPVRAHGRSERWWATRGPSRLFVWMWDDNIRFDLPRIRRNGIGRSPHDSCLHYMDRHALAIGLIASATELRVVLTDRDGTRHVLSLALTMSDPSHGKGLSDTIRWIAGLCNPSGVAAVGQLLDELREYRHRQLDQLQGRLRGAIEQFLDGAVGLDENRAVFASWTLERNLATQLWQEALLFAFCLRGLASAEAGSHASGCPSSPPSHVPLQLLPSRLLKVRDGSAARGDPIPDWEECLHEFLTVFAGASTSPNVVVAAFGSLLPHEPFAHLRRLRFTSQSCLRMIESTLVDPDTHEQPPLVSTSDLADVFEAMLGLCPGIASVPMVRHRRGKVTIVSPAKRGSGSSNETAREETSSAQRRSRRAVPETIAAGSFYVYQSQARKSSGAFYTPPPLVEYLLNDALRQVRISARKGAAVSSLLTTRLLDPAAGAGAFLLRASRRLADAVLVAAAEKSPDIGETRRSRSEPTDHSVRSDEGTPIRDIQRVSARLSVLLEEIRSGGGEAAQRYCEARALCHAAVTTHCIYGVDKNPLAACIARLLLWLDCLSTDGGAVGLDRHVIAGDSLIGPRLGQLLTLPVSGTALEPHLFRTLKDYIRDFVTSATGGEPARELSLVLAFTAAAWTGAVMLGTVAGDEAYARFIQHLRSDRAGPEWDDPTLRHLRAIGHDAVCFELSFPEVFLTTRDGPLAPGFSVVVGNPPWDAVKANSREVLAEFDPRVFEVTTRSERDALTRSLSRSPRIAERLAEYESGFARRKRAHDRQFSHQKIVIDGDLAGRQLDLFRLFIERSWQLLTNDGRLGLVVPSAFHTAAGAVGVRRLLLRAGRLESYVVFRNDQRLFDISRGFEFGLLIAQKTRARDYCIRARFGLEQPHALTVGRHGPALRLRKRAILAGNPYATIPATNDEQTVEIATAILLRSTRFVRWSATTGVELRSTPSSVHRTHESPHFARTPTEGDARLCVFGAREVLTNGAVLHEGCTFGRYDDLWSAPPRFSLQASRVLTVPRWRSSIAHYRIVLRAIVGSSPHKCIAAMIPPGTLVANSALVEGSPERRPSALALATLAVLNSSVASWLLSLQADLNVNLFALRQLAFPHDLPTRFLAHSALRLSANHAGWEKLMNEQLGKAWLGSEEHRTYPVVIGADRVHLIAGVDAAVAAAYGLRRAHYEAILSRFGAEWNSASVQQCLQAFDELDAMGLDAFARTLDPYNGLELVLECPQPAFDLPVDIQLAAMNGS